MPPGDSFQNNAPRDFLLVINAPPAGYLRLLMISGALQKVHISRHDCVTSEKRVFKAYCFSINDGLIW